MRAWLYPLAFVALAAACFARFGLLGGLLAIVLGSLELVGIALMVSLWRGGAGDG